MRAHVRIWMLLLLCVLTVPAFAEDDDALFEDVGEAAPKATAKGAAEKPASEDADELFGDPDEEMSEEAAPPRKLHTRAEIKASLTKENAVIAEQLAKFIALNKQLAKEALESGNKDEIMLVLREYGPAVIRMKQHWIGVVGNPAKYDTWIGSPQYKKAWGAFHSSWNSLYGFTDRFAAIDMDLADKISDGLAGLGHSFNEYNAWADEWDGKFDNDTHQFARGEDVLNEIADEQFREEEDADKETEQVKEDLDAEEADEDSSIGVNEAEQDAEQGDEKGENRALDEGDDQFSAEEGTKEKILDGKE